MTYTSKQIGETGTLEYRLYTLENNEVRSPFHDCPLWVGTDKSVVNMLVEIPRGTNAKMEISTTEFMNPIKQDVKNGKLRFVHDKYPFNYGALPQTWENPWHIDSRTNAKGDNDPIDVCEIGSALGVSGQFKQCKIIGVWAMIDDGETDWKILCIDVTDPLADQINSIADLKNVIPGKIEEVYTFLRDYKIPDGKGPNNFAFNGDLLDKEMAVKVIDETHADWEKLISGQTESKHSCVCVSKGTVNGAEATAKLNL
eukprot:gene424-503_t